MGTDNNPVEAVRARLDGGRKWIKGDLGDTEGTGPVCLVGAIVSTGAAGVLGLLGAVAKEQYPERMGCDPWDTSSVAFNNHPDTIWADVDLVLDKAARRWDEQVTA